MERTIKEIAVFGAGGFGMEVAMLPPAHNRCSLRAKPLDLSASCLKGHQPIHQSTNQQISGEAGTRRSRQGAMIPVGRPIGISTNASWSEL